MTRILTILLVALFAMAVGCGKSAEQQPVAEEAPEAVAAPVAPAPALPVPAEADQPLALEESKALQSAYLTQARAEITPENADAILEALTKEIDADLAVE